MIKSIIAFHVLQVILPNVQEYFLERVKRSILFCFTNLIVYDIVVETSGGLKQRLEVDFHLSDGTLPFLLLELLHEHILQILSIVVLLLQLYLHSLEIFLDLLDVLVDFGAQCTHIVLFADQTQIIGVDLHRGVLHLAGSILVLFQQNLESARVGDLLNPPQELNKDSLYLVFWFQNVLVAAVLLSHQDKVHIIGFVTVIAEVELLLLAYFPLNDFQNWYKVCCSHILIKIFE